MYVVVGIETRNRDRHSEVTLQIEHHEAVFQTEESGTELLEELIAYLTGLGIAHKRSSEIHDEDTYVEYVLGVI
jgi:hypothetical protein